MNKNRKIFLGILTFLPVVYMILFVFVWFITFFIAMSGDHHSVEFMFFPVFFLLHGFMMLLCIGLWIYYLIHATKNENFDSNQKMMWILIVVLGSFIGMIAYYVVNIWKDPQPKSNIPA